jgi:hypothetical protein
MKNRWFVFLAFILSLSTHLFAETAVNTDAVKKMIVFIFASRDGDVDKKNPLGTGFFVVIPRKGAAYSANDPTSAISGSLVLITARHIVDPAWAFCSRPQPDTVYLRLNKKNYDASKDVTGIDYVPIHLVENGLKKYFISDDDRVDAAVIDVTLESTIDLGQDKYDYQPYSLSNFADSSEVNALRIGDSIVSAGLLPNKSGERRNYPFFKFGNISNIPDEPTWISCEGRIELRLERAWFIAANLVGGNSGSPIFYDPPEMCLMGGIFHCTRGLDRPMIIGIQSMSIGDIQFGSSDVAGMTPIEDVYKIIQQHYASDGDLYRGDDTKRKQ